MLNETIRQGTSDESNFIAQKLIDFNLSQVPFGQNPPWDKLCLVALNEAGEVIGGVNASLVWGSSLSIHQLWVDERYRGKNIGSNILDAIEQLGRDKGAHIAHLDTTDFQAQAFYLKHGYETFGMLEGSPCQGHKRYYMKKDLLSLQTSLGKSDE